MTWEFYEVWSVDDLGHEELIDTTQSLKEARLLAEQSLTEYYAECIIYKEDADGDLVELERLTL
jgi:hypothetical protein